MNLKWIVIVTVLIIAVTGCSHVVPSSRNEAKTAIMDVYARGAQKEFPVEYRNALDTFMKGEGLLAEDEVDDANELFLFALTKARLLDWELASLKARREEEARKLKLEAEKREKERQDALKEAERKTTLEREETELKKTQQKSRHVKERSLPVTHTVKRGETLPQIAAQSDIYNDYRLWPLIYRANRDQIRDPKHVWPGQVLRIPRNSSREEYSEARRYAQEKPIR